MMKQKTVFFLWALVALSCWKLTFRCSVGSHIASFSCFTLILPLIGAFLSRRAASFSSMSMWGLANFAHLPITLGIPTFLATLSWNASDQTSQRALHVALPLTCMVLFCLFAETGSWLYSLYWLIPVALHFFPSSTLCRAFQSTFVAHAIGSVIWAYFIPMSASAWLSLIPVVAIERLLMASISAFVVLSLKATERATQSNPARAL